MNIILFSPEEFPPDAPAATTSAPPSPLGRGAGGEGLPQTNTLALPRADPRAAHILDVLRRKPGDTFDAGLVDGPRGKGTLAAISSGDGALALGFAWERTVPPPLPPITLIIGLPRPQTARKILNEATSLGVSEMHFVTTGRGEPSYAQSTLWTSGEYRRHLVAGAAQAFCTRIPRVTFGKTLAETIATLDATAAAQPDARRIALDNYEAPASLGELLSSAPNPHSAIRTSHSALRTPHSAFIFCLGSERGWTAAEREQLRAARFAFAHLGARVLRAETAVTAAVSLALAHSGRM